MTTQVCFVVNTVSETSVPSDIAAAVAEHTDVSVDVMAWFGSSGFHGSEHVGVIDLDGRTPDADGGLGTYRRVRETLGRYDIVQAHHNHSGSIAKVLARLSGVSVVSREGNMRRGFGRVGRVANGLTNPLADRVVCNSRAVYESFRRWENALLSDDKVVFIPNGVDFDRLDSADGLSWRPTDDVAVEDGAVVVGTAGLLTEQKDHETLVRGVAAARRRSDRPVELLIAGDGPLRSELEAVADSCGVRDAVHFLGRLDRSEVYAMLADIDVYAMPSRWEGFSAAAVEAVGSGTPCVFSDIPPFEQPYADVARFHPVGDHERLGEHLADLAADPDRDRLGERGRQLVEENYTLERVARQYRDLYAEIVD